MAAFLKNKKKILVIKNRAIGDTILMSGVLRLLKQHRPQHSIHALVRAVPARVVEVGDPGVIHDADTAPEDLPAYEGPPEPLAAHTHEWGADVAAEAGLPDP